MLFSYEKKIIIKYLRIKYEHCDTRISSDHSEYEWDVNGGKKLLKKIERLVTLLEKKVRTEENIELIEEIILSQEVSQELILLQQILHVNLIFIVDQCPV